MTAKSGKNPNFTPFHRPLLYYPVGQNFARNRSISYRFRDIHFFIYCKKSKMATKSGKNLNFTPLHRTLLYYLAGQKFARNSSISYGFRDIHTFSFSAKIQDGRPKWRKSKFYAFPQATLVLPRGSKICSKSLYLLRFSRYSHFFHFPQKSKMAVKSGEN